jgi:predicted transglutaminase-like cysteine proteinase
MRGTMSRRALLAQLAAGAACATAGVGLASPAAAQEAKPGIFSSLETPKAGLEPFPKWSGALQKFFAELGAAQQGCTPTATNKCYYAAWAALIAGLKEKPVGEQLQGVNDFMNQAPYVVDMINWGIDDYWESPGEFFGKFGDCEDYAIAKFLTLRALNVPSSAMRVVVVQDLNLKVGHAITAVYVANRILVMDNQIKPIVAAETIKHYLPLFSLNEEGWWLHRPA